MTAILVSAVVALVIVRLFRGTKKAAPAAAPSSSPLLPVLAAAAGIGGVSWWMATHPGPKVITAPAPRPQPTVTVTAPPHVTGPVSHLLTGGDIVAIYVIGAVVAIVLVGTVLRRSS